MKASIALLAVALLFGCGCNKSAAVVQAEYTNSIEGELNTQRKIADFAYAYGYAQAVVEANREKFGNNFDRNLNIPEQSQADMDRQVAQIFWDLRTNATARDRVNKEK